MSTPWIAILAASGATAAGTGLAVRSVGTAGLPGCAEGSGCNAVTRGRWSRVGPLPVAVVGAAAYLALLLAALAGAGLLGQRGPVVDVLVAAVALIVLGAAAWFVLLQAIVIRRFCAYCMTTHGLACASAVPLLIANAGWRTPAWHTELVIAAVCVGTLIFAQLLLRPKLFAITRARTEPQGGTPPGSLGDPQPAGHPEPQAMAAPAPPPIVRRRVTLLGGQIVLNTGGWPLLGRPDAQHVLALLFDFTCTECHHLRRLLAAAVEARPDWLAVALVPVPLHPGCNPTVKCFRQAQAQACDYARLAWAIWLADLDGFAAWDQFVRSEAEGQPYGLALNRGHELADLDRFHLGEPNPRLDQAVATGVGLYRAAGTPKVPALLLPAAVLQGHVADLPELVRTLRSNLPDAPARPTPSSALASRSQHGSDNQN